MAETKMLELFGKVTNLLCI